MWIVRRFIQGCSGVGTRWNAVPANILEPERRSGKYRTVSTQKAMVKGRGIGSPYSITERRVPELIPVLGSQPAGGMSHKPGGRLPLLSARPAVTSATLERAATSEAAW